MFGYRGVAVIYVQAKIRVFYEWIMHEKSLDIKKLAKYESFYDIKILN